MRRQRNEPRSFAMLIGAMFIYGSVGIFRRYIPVTSGLLSLIRGVLGALFLLVLMKLTNRKLIPRTDRKTKLLLVVSGAFIGFNWILLFESYNYTSVPTATLCYYLEPSIVMLVSPLLFKEKLGLKKGLCAAASFVGMVLVSGIAETGLPSASEIKGILLGIGAALLYSAVVILNKKLGDTEPFSRTFIQLCSAAVVVFPYVLTAEDIAKLPCDARSLILTAVLGIVHTGIAYALYFGAIGGLRTQTTAIFSYVDPITAVLLSFVILHERLSLPAFVGAVIMLASAIISVVGDEKSED